MTKHRNFTIEPSEHWVGYEAVHENYQGDWLDGLLRGSHPVFQCKTAQDCIEQIDDWYGEQDGN